MLFRDGWRGDPEAVEFFNSVFEKVLQNCLVGNLYNLELQNLISNGIYGYKYHGSSQDFFRGGGHFAKKFQKNFKKYSKNVLKNFVKIYKKYPKNLKNIQKKFKKFSKKITKKFVKKIAKMDFLAYFSKNLTNPAFNFCAFGRKTLFAGNF